MKINANEMLLINKNLKLKGDEAESASSAVALMDAPDSENTMNALNLQGMNNIAFQGVNTAAVKKMGLSSIAALSLLGGTLTSCADGKDEPEYKYPPGTTIVYDNTQITVNININIYMTDEELVAAVLAEQQKQTELLQNIVDNQERQEKINQAILAELLRQGITLDRIMTLLEDFDMTVNDIFNLLKDNSEKQEEFFNTMSQDNKEIKAWLEKLYKSHEAGNKLSAQNNKLLTAALAQLAQGNKNDEMLMTLVKFVISKIDESIENNKEIANKQFMFMYAILGKLDKLDATMQKGIFAILNKMDEVSDANLALLTSILNAVNEGNKKDDLTNQILVAIYNKVDESISTNKEIANKQNMLLHAILGKLDHINDTLKRGILSILNKIDSVSEANVELLTNIFNAIEEGNANDEVTNKILTAIYNKVDESISTNKEIAAKQNKLLNLILLKLSSINSNMKQGILALINKIDKVSEANYNMLMDIFNAIQEGNENDGVTNDLLAAIYAKVQESIDTNKEMDAKTQAMLRTIMAKMDKASAANIVLLTKILNELKISNQNDQYTNDILTAIYDKVQESIDTNKEMDSKTHELLGMILDKLSKMDNNMKASVKAILAHIDRASAANIKLLVALVNKVDAEGTTDRETKDILYAILAKIQESIDTNKEMDAKTHVLLNAILDNVQGLNAKLKAAVKAILAKMDQMSAENKALIGDVIGAVNNMSTEMQDGFAAVINNQNKMSAENRAFYNQILARIDKLDKNAQRGIGMLLQQMAINNSIDAAILNKIEKLMVKLDNAHKDDVDFYNRAIALLSELLSKADKLGNKADAILDVISNISLDANVDLSKIEKMLEDLLAQTKANGATLTSIDSKLNFLGVTVEGIKTSVERMDGDHKAIIARLDAILAKIPGACKCDASLQVIIEKLDALIESLEKGDNKHEGILDDLDNLFG